MLLKRVLIGLVTLGLAVGAFWFYSHHYRTPNISRHALGEPNDTLNQTGLAGGQGGQLSGLTVGEVSDFVFEFRDDDYRVYQKLGFQEIISKQSGVWQVVNPFVTRYEEDVTCFVTANRGTFRIEEVNNNAYPRDGVFSGAVKVHVVPKPGSGIEEIHIDLEEIVFQSSKSRFTSSGQVMVRSPSVRMSGRGIDFIYNDDRKCIQYFRMVALDYLRVRTPREGGLFSFGNDTEEPEPPVPSQDANGLPSEVNDVSVPEDPPGAIYTCLLQDNVVIRTPKQKVHSLNHISLTNILWPKTAFGQQDANAPDPNAAQALAADVNLPEPNAPWVAGDVNGVPPLDANGLEVAASCSEDPNATLPDEEILDIIITCDQGILVSPADSNWTPESEGLAKPEVADVIDVNIPTFAVDVNDEAIFVAQDIACNVQTMNAKAEGPVELTFYADPNEMDMEGRLIPINVTAQEYGRFDANDNSIVFTDQCECILQRQDANDVVEEYRLEAPKIRIELVDEKDAEAIAAQQDLKHMEAVGGNVTLGIFTRMNEANLSPGEFAPATGELLAGAEMICESFECDPNKGREIFTAQGPGTIMFNNAKAALGGSSDKEKEPYYAILQGFDTMKYHVAENLIVADASDPNILQFSYFPLMEDPNMEGQANHVEIHLVKTEGGRTEMDTMVASGNVSVTHGQNQFTGGFLSYSHDSMSLVVRPGKEGRPCTVNGVSYPGIDYNLTTGELKTSVSNISVLPLQ